MDGDFPLRPLSKFLGLREGTFSPAVYRLQPVRLTSSGRVIMCLGKGWGQERISFGAQVSVQLPATEETVQNSSCFSFLHCALRADREPPSCGLSQLSQPYMGREMPWTILLFASGESEACPHGKHQLPLPHPPYGAESTVGPLVVR